MVEKELRPLFARHRELSATMGRWMQQDPIGFKSGDKNLYLSYRNNPVVMIDPTGTYVPVPWVMATGCLFGAVLNVGNVLIQSSKSGFDSCVTPVRSVLSGLIGCAQGCVLANATTAATWVVKSLRFLGLGKWANAIDKSRKIRMATGGAIGLNTGWLDNFTQEAAEAICDLMRAEDSESNTLPLVIMPDPPPRLPPIMIPGIGPNGEPIEGPLELPPRQPRPRPSDPIDRISVPPDPRDRPPGPRISELLREAELIRRYAEERDRLRW